MKLNRNASIPFSTCIITFNICVVFIIQKVCSKNVINPTDIRFNKQGKFVDNAPNETLFSRKDDIKLDNKTIKLTRKQGLIMNQILSVFSVNSEKNKKCKEHITEFKMGLRSFKPWALQMFDASSKLQSGILGGNLVEYGAFVQCLGIYQSTDSGVIRGKQCGIRISPNTKLVKTILSYRNVSDKRFERLKFTIVEGVTLIWSVCVPDSCKTDDVLSHFSKSITEISEGLNLSITMNDMDCVSVENRPNFTSIHYVLISIVFLIILIATVCTLIDYYTECSVWMVTSFSIIANSRRLLSFTENDDLGCLHGVRFISVCYVMFGHRFLVGMMFPSINSLDLIDWVLKYSSTIIIGGNVCVDSFLLVSGTLVSYVFFKEVTRRKHFNLALFYLHRYIRITPSLSLVVTFYACFLQFFGSGPIWNSTYVPMQNACKQYWWSTVLHIQNYVNPQLLCIPQTWYLTCDTLYYFFSPILLYPIWKWPSHFGPLNLTLWFVVPIIWSFYIAWNNRYPPGMPLTRLLFDNKYFQRYYIAPHARMGPYLIGICLGYIIFKSNQKPLKIGLLLRSFVWCVAIILMLFPFIHAHWFESINYEYNQLEAATFLSLFRSGWALGLAWLIFSCVKGCGGIANNILSLYIFKIGGRIGYGIFLCHMCLQFLKAGAAKLPSYYSNFYMIYECCADLVIMVIIGTLFTLLFEYPFLQFGKALFKPDKSIPNQVGVQKLYK